MLVVVVLFGVRGSANVTACFGGGFPIFRGFLGASHPGDLPTFYNCIHSIFSTHTILSMIEIGSTLRLNNSSRLVKPPTIFYVTTRTRK